VGFFSWNCKKCNHSIKSPYDIPTGWEHMGQAVVLQEGQEPVIGEYDGYGTVGPLEVNSFGGDEPEMWHKLCWENAGKPEYSGGSEYASDQGYFYDDPSDEELVEAIRATE
jgi:hypothetical protein